MNVDQALQVFRSEDDEPNEALQWSLDHWDAVSDRLLSKLRAISANLANDPDDPAFDDGDGMALFYLVHLFGEMRDKRAYAPLCERLMRDKNPYAWLGDCVTQTLSGVLINVYDGDLEPIQRIVENASLDEYVRGAALESLAYLVCFADALSEEAARTYLDHLYEKAEPRGPSWLWVVWMETAAHLGYQDFGPRAARLLSKHWVSDGEISMREFNALLAKARSAPEEGFSDDGIKPFGSTIALVDSFRKTYQPDKERGSEAAPLVLFGTPHVNPLRDVGRNDPCPCGSGKKYKKCCLPA
jgi:uncharacterized protein